MRRDGRLWGGAIESRASLAAPGFVSLWPSTLHSLTFDQSMSREAIFEASVGYFLTPIKAFLEDDTVTEIMVNGFNEIYIERRGRLERTDASFPSHDALLSAVHNVAQFVNREIDLDRPIMAARVVGHARRTDWIEPRA